MSGEGLSAQEREAMAEGARQAVREAARAALDVSPEPGDPGPEGNA